MSDGIILESVLLDTLAQITEQIDELTYQANSMGIRPHRMRLTDGSWPMIPLLVAKSNILLALVQEQ